MNPRQLIIPLICLLAVQGHGQQQSELCPKILVDAPDTVVGNGSTFDISAKFENEGRSATNFEWVVLRDSGPVSISSRPRIKLETGKAKDGEWVIAIAQPSEMSCKGFGVSKTLVVPNFGSPLILDQYDTLRWNDEAVRLDATATWLREKSPGSELIIHIAFGRSETRGAKRAYLTRIAGYLSKKWKISAERITFLISDPRERRTTRLQPYPAELMSEFPISEQLVVKAEDLPKLELLFGSN